MQRIGILGSTGSIGTSALEVVSRFPDRFKVELLSTHSNIELLQEQVNSFGVRSVSIVEGKKANEFRKRFGRGKIKIYEGEEGLCSAVGDIKIDTLLVGIIGSSALLPILGSLKNISRLALANKEALVMAGNIIIKVAKKENVKILPVDSEHSAIFQCIHSNSSSQIRRIYITSSGGPLLNISKKELKNITPPQAINHPKWKMGKKISIDSATMMNKGLEVIEAHHLFDMDVKDIEVLIHPETVIHSMVEFIDGAILAQLGICDMKLPIQYALTYPSRFTSSIKGVSFSKLKTLHFYSPDVKKFPCLRIARQVAKHGDTYPCVLNASNEVAVSEFLKKRIKFMDIPKIIEKVLELHKPVKSAGLEDVLEVDRWARRRAGEILENIQ